MREKIKSFVEGHSFQNTIIVLILINAVILGAETSSYLMERFGLYFKIIDGLILKIFVIEIILRLFVYRWKFFIRPWSVFDFIVVAIALVPASQAFSAIRALRVLRVLRIISTIPSMRKVVEGLLNAIPGIISVASIMVLIFYVFAVIGTHLYSSSFPEWFGTIGKTMFTLFQILTLESWSMGIVRPVMVEYPYAWIYFILYILVATFTMLNLFIAIIVNAMHSSADETAEESRMEIKHDLFNALNAMEERLRADIKKQNKDSNKE